MTVAVCTENAMIDEDICLFRQALADDGELIGERLHPSETAQRDGVLRWNEKRS